MLNILIFAPLLLLLALALLLGWLWWRAEEEAKAKVFDSSIQHTKED